MITKSTNSVTRFCDFCHLYKILSFCRYGFQIILNIYDFCHFCRCRFCGHKSIKSMEFVSFVDYMGFIVKSIKSMKSTKHITIVRNHQMTTSGENSNFSRSLGFFHSQVPPRPGSVPGPGPVATGGVPYAQRGNSPLPRAGHTRRDILFMGRLRFTSW